MTFYRVDEMPKKLEIMDEPKAPKYRRRGSFEFYEWFWFSTLVALLAGTLVTHFFYGPLSTTKFREGSVGWTIVGILSVISSFLLIRFDNSSVKRQKEQYEKAVAKHDRWEENYRKRVELELELERMRVEGSLTSSQNQLITLPGGSDAIIVSALQDPETSSE